MLYLAAENLLQIKRRERDLYLSGQVSNDTVIDAMSILPNVPEYRDFSYLAIPRQLIRYKSEYFDGMNLFEYDQECERCKFLNCSYNNMRANIEKADMTYNMFKDTGYWFLQIVFGRFYKNDKGGLSISNFEYSRNRRVKLFHNNLACCRDHLLYYPMHVLEEHTLPTYTNEKRRETYNCVSISANRLMPNYVSKDKHRYIGYPIVDYEKRVYTYHTVMNFKSLNGYFGRDMLKYYKEGKGFTIGFASDVIVTDDMMNYYQVYNYDKYGKVFIDGFTNTTKFFGQFMQTLLSYSFINSLHAIMFAPNVDFVSYY